MKIAIYHKKNSFSERWITYCQERNIPYILVNVYATDLIQQLEGCDIFMWHHHHNDFKDQLIAKRILFALEHAGIKVFPDFKTGWHFDDKVAQKYLLEAINAPLVQSWVFYDKATALAWAEQTDYPKVWKLKGGAGASNVKLIRTKSKAKKHINKAFSKGFSQFNKWGYLNDRIRRYKEGKDNYLGILRGIGRLFIPTSYAKEQGNEKGYAYFQEFIPNNIFDIRVIIVANKAFAIKRMVRTNDFRASGSGNIIYDYKQIPKKCIEIAFDIYKKLEVQCIGFDFVIDQNHNPLIVEMGYGFSIEAYDECLGYWDINMNWHENKFNPQNWMIESIIISNE